MIVTDVSGWQIEGYVVTPPRPVGNARALWAERKGLIVTLWNADGAWGQGECSPLPGYSRDELDACETALRQALSEPPGGAGEGTPAAARFALETARLDLAARAQGVSLARALCGHAPWPRVARSALLGAATDDDLTARVGAAVARGCVTAKLKVGATGSFERELNALVTLRNIYKNCLTLRLDANGAWGVEEARAKLSRLAQVAPELVEQPVAGDEIFSLGACAVPWAADECLQDLAVAERVLSEPPAGCVAVVLKPALLGLMEARSVALRAQAAGLGVIVTHLFDGPIAMAAACALALSLPEVPWACGLDVHGAFDAWGVALAQHAQGGWITDVDAPGTGLPRLSAREMRRP